MLRVDIFEAPKELFQLTVYQALKHEAQKDDMIKLRHFSSSLTSFSLMIILELKNVNWFLGVIYANKKEIVVIPTNQTPNYYDKGRSKQCKKFESYFIINIIDILCFCEN